MRKIWLTTIIAFSLALSPSAFASSKTAIVLRATGSGAAIGAAAGLISYPFAKSTGTIIAGALVGAVLGTVYGFHLANERQHAYEVQQITLAPRPAAQDPVLAAREWSSRRGFSGSDTLIAIPLSF